DAVAARRAGDAVRALVPKPWERANRELLALTEENRALQDDLDRIEASITLVHGTWDPVCPHDGTIDAIRTRFPDAVVHSVERGGHNLHLSHADLVGEIIRERVDHDRND
ncbi:MAG: alpha/beta hydrolase, partial [Phycisphaerales bacterium]|nr:alpha/beta hydrolase [Phycisphaerales bacterium]